MIKYIERLLSIILFGLCLKLGYDIYLRIETEKIVSQEAEIREEQIWEHEKEELPKRYDGREHGRAPIVKNQGSLGTCWAITATSAMETYLLPEEQLVFSADHMSLQNSFSKSQDDGGDYTMVMAYLAGWQGPVLDEDDPYGDGVTTEGLLPICHVQEMQMIKDKDYDAIKRAVQENGAVQSSIYMDLKNEFSTSVYYNQLEYSYYYNGDAEANHDILIIGWDDEYQAERFNVNTDKAGAFICQNSWGTDFADEGIFYISYEDVNIGENCIVYSEIESVSNFDHIYQTDQCGWVGQLGYGDGDCWFANIYRSEQKETLQAVGFYSTGKDTQYRVYVMEKNGNMPSMALEEPIALGCIENPGYYTVSLEQEIGLEMNREYIVAVRVHTPNVKYPVATEYAADDATRNVVISDGEGYISHNGVIWTRTETEHGCNVCLKAYTKNVE